MSKLIIENLLSDLALKCVSKNLGREINDDRIKSTLMAAVDQNWEIVEDILFSQNPKFTMEDYQERMAESLSHGQNTTLRDFSINKQKGVVYTGMNYLPDLQGKNGCQENMPNVVSNDYNTGHHPKFQNGRRWLNQHRHFSRNFQPNFQNGRNFNQSRHWGQKFNTHFQNGRHQPRQIYYNNNNFNKNHQNGLQNSQQIRNVAQTGPYVTQNGRHGTRQFKNKIHSAYQWSKKGTFGQSQHFQKQNGRPVFVNCTMRHHMYHFFSQPYYAAISYLFIIISIKAYVLNWYSAFLVRVWCPNTNNWLWLYIGNELSIAWLYWWHITY